MLQINSGKFYTRPIEYENKLTGVLFSNANIINGGTSSGVIKTIAGKFTSAGRVGNIENIVFDMVERIEKQKGERPGVLVSHCIESYLPEIAALFSFVTETTTWHKSESIERLIVDGRSPSGYGAPNTYIQSVFDTNRTILPDTCLQLSEFIENIIGLRRQTYAQVIRAIILLVTGLHRLDEDINLSYALMVASIETVAAVNPKALASWEQLDGRKRKIFNKAFDGLEEEQTQKLKNAIVEAEHLGSSARFRAFVSDNVPDAYFRRPTEGRRRLLCKYELLTALREAYNLRSKYIHSAQRLPDAIAHPHNYWEVHYHKRNPVLSHQGLYSLARASIINFVLNQPKVETESHEYRYDRPGIVMRQLAPQYWLANEVTDAKHIYKRIEGLLSQHENIYRKDTNANLTDIRPISESLISLLEKASDFQFQQILIFLTLFNGALPSELQWEHWEDIYIKHNNNIWKCNRLSIVMTPIFGYPETWSLDQHQKALDSYFSNRIKPKGIHAPRLFEAAFCIILADRYREIGDNAKTIELLNTAADIDTGNKFYLIQLENISLDNQLNWTDLLLEKPDFNLEAE